MKALFQETRIKSLALSNRVIRSATWMAMANADGSCNERLFNCYETLARGGVGLIITGFAFVSREGQGPQGQLGIHSDRLVDGLRTLVNKVHSQGGKIAAQIVHCGNMSKPENNGGLEVLGPSERLDKDGIPAARAMTEKEISRIVDAMGAAAHRAKEAGFDAVQLHFAHGYLGSQFLSPRHNQRNDGYGGSIENRCRFLRETFAKVRGAVGEAFPVLAKLNLQDFLDDGLVPEEGLHAAKELARLGLDALEVSGGTAESGALGPARRLRDGISEAYFLENARAAKEATGLPVILVGGLRSPGLIKKIFEEGGVDYFALSRPLIREPHLINRWRDGDLRPADCVSCSGCFLTVKYGRGIFCIKTRKDAI